MIGNQMAGHGRWDVRPTSVAIKRNRRGSRYSHLHSGLINTEALGCDSRQMWLGNSRNGGASSKIQPNHEWLSNRFGAKVCRNPTALTLVTETNSTTAWPPTSDQTPEPTRHTIRRLPIVAVGFSPQLWGIL